MFTSPRVKDYRPTSEITPRKDINDLEAGVLRDTTTTLEESPSAQQPLPTPPAQTSAAVTAAAAAVHPLDSPMTPAHHGHHRSAAGSATSSNGGFYATESPLRRRRASSSSWSGRDLVATAEELDRVKVTPAWSLNAALGAMAISSSASVSDGMRAATTSTSAAATIVRQVVAAQSTGLVLCGCAGSGQPPMMAAVARGGRGNGGGGVPGAPRARFAAPLSGANSVHGKWPSLSRSRHGPMSLGIMARSWHGKSRHHGGGGRSHMSSRHAAGGGGHPAAAQGMGVRPSSLRGGLESAIDGVINDALEYLVGDVAGALLACDQAPAVLAVRAGATTIRPVAV